MIIRRERPEDAEWVRVVVRAGFRPAGEYDISAPQPSWGQYFQVRTLGAYTEAMRGRFAYAEPFDQVS